jgi:hypothetical protein
MVFGGSRADLYPVFERAATERPGDGGGLDERTIQNALLIGAPFITSVLTVLIPAH